MERKAQLTSQGLDNIVNSHMIEPSLLRVDDFHEFFKTRQEALLATIERVMGKPAQRTETEDETGEIDESLDEDEYEAAIEV